MKDPALKMQEEQIKLLKEQVHLLKEQNKMLDVLVAAEYANAQATEGLMKAFEGSSGNRTLDHSLEQMRRMAGLDSE